MNDKALQDFLYILARDHLPVGVIERLVREAEETAIKSKDDIVVYSNEYLFEIARQFSRRLTRNHTTAP